MELLHDVPLSKVHPDPNNPRGDITAESVKDLAASIASVGLIEPIVVRPNGTGDTYTITAGHRRYAALKSLKQKSVSVLLHYAENADGTVDEVDASMAQLIENLQREDLRPVAEARALFRLVGLGLKQKDMPKALGRTAAWVKDRLALLELPESIQAKVDAGDVSIANALELLKLKKPLGDKFEDKAVKLLPQAGSSWFSTTVDTELTKLADAQEKAAIRAEAKEYGWGVKFAVGSYSVPQGVRLLTPRHTDKPAINVGKHKDLPCHMWLVCDEWDAAAAKRGLVRHDACSDPDSHEPDGSSKLKWHKRVNDQAAADAEAARERAEAQERRRADAERRVNFAGTIVGAVKAGDVSSMAVDLVVEAATERNWDERQSTVAALVGLDVDSELTGWQRHERANKLVRAWVAAGGAAERRKLVAAVWWARLLETCHGWNDAALDAMNRLVEAGYVLDETLAAHKAELERRAVEAAEREAKAAERAEAAQVEILEQLRALGGDDFHAQVVQRLDAAGGMHGDLVDHLGEWLDAREGDEPVYEAEAAVVLQVLDDIADEIEAVIQQRIANAVAVATADVREQVKAERDEWFRTQVLDYSEGCRSGKVEFLRSIDLTTGPETFEVHLAVRADLFDVRDHDGDDLTEYGDYEFNAYSFGKLIEHVLENVPDGITVTSVDVERVD